jgi:amino acid permease
MTLPSDELTTRAIFTVGIGFILLMPVSLKKDMSSFRYITFVAILAEIYTGIVLIIQLPKYMRYALANPTIYKEDYAIFDLNFFKGCSIVFFAYTCSAQLFPIYSELISPTARRIKTVIRRAHIIDLVFYFMIALPGYFGTFSLTPKMVLDRENIPGDDEVSIILMIAQILQVLVLFICVPCNYVPFRQQFFVTFFKRTEYSTKE